MVFLRRQDDRFRAVLDEFGDRAQLSADEAAQVLQSRCLLPVMQTGGMPHDLLAELAGAAADADPPVAERWTEYLFDLIDEGREEPTAPAGLRRMTAEALGGGICTRLYAAIVRDGRLPDEAEIVPELMYCVVLPYCGRDAAREELEISPPPRSPTGSGAPYVVIDDIKRTGTGVSPRG